MADLRFIKLPDGKEWMEQRSIKKEVIFKDNVKSMRDKKEMERINRLKPFGDADKDGIPNIIDKRPFKKDKNVWGFLLK